MNPALCKDAQLHANVEGPDFSKTHKFFEGQYEQLEETMLRSYLG